MEHVHVSTAVRAVEGRFVFDRRQFRGVVCATLLEKAFGGRQSPDGWLAAYRANASVIDAALSAKAKVTIGVQVVVLTESDIRLFALPTKAA
jgi:hypothetical protein